MIKFSVVIPVYNAEATIKETITSCLNQTLPPFEIIVIDDCSTDKSIQVIKKSFDSTLIAIISLPINSGVATARNTGWDYSKGDYVAFLDADDIWHSNRLILIDEVLNNNINDIACIGNLYTDKGYQLHKEGSPIGIVKLSFWNILLRNYFNTSCLVVKRNLSVRFNGKMRYTEDHDLLIRISNIHKVYLLNVYLTLLGRPQLTEGGLSGDKLKMRFGEIRMYFSALKCNHIIILLLPFLIAYSVLKYINKIVK
ncbi:MAG: putative glycosyltransferase O-antigen related protein [Sphingobacteriales bacterium]|nr:putative glycosyltransferase O-antigen related protein [Sphingobacteriales bacterium]